MLVDEALHSLTERRTISREDARARRENTVQGEKSRSTLLASELTSEFVSDNQEVATQS